MKISLITAVYNRAGTIEKAIQSVLSQDYPNVEYIIVDGGSKDGTVGVIEKYRHKISKFISEKDNGIYDALNKGIKLATGDIVGILHSDDYFASDDMISRIMHEFMADPKLEAVYGDLDYVRQNSTTVVRHYSSKDFSPSKFASGFMPAHPSFFCRRDCFAKYGLYRTDLEIAADFDLLIRFMYLNKIKTKYLPLCMIHMGIGGKSTSGMKSVLKINSEFREILRSHGITSSYFRLYSRYFKKIREFF